MNGRKGYISAAIEAECAKRRDRYHTPGHKGEIDGRDITELGESGSVFPSDAVQKAEANSAAIYKVPYIRFLTGGSSMGIKAALLAFRGSKVLYADGSHISFTEGCELAEINAVPIGANVSRGAVYTCGCKVLPPPPTPEEVELALKANPDAKAVFITSPDYLGRTAHTDIARICRDYGIKLIADSAHGAHFAFAPGLGKYRFDGIADYCNMSAHKTLGAYTQTALLAVREREDVQRAEHNLKLLGTTSPNYVMLARLEDSVREAAASGGEYLRLKAFRDELVKRVKLLENSDYTRLCVMSEKCTADELFGKLTDKGVMPEAVIDGKVVFILTPYDTEDKLTRLFKILTECL